MNIQTFVLVLISLFGISFLLYGLCITKKKFSSVISSAFFGFLFFCVIALTSSFTGIYVGVNLPSLIVSVILGIPGVIFLIIMNLF